MGSLNLSSPVAQQAIQGVFAGPTQAKTGQRNAELGDRKQTPRIGQQTERALRAGLPLRGEFAQTRLAHRNEGNFRRRKESVGGQNEDQNEKS